MIGRKMEPQLYMSCTEGKRKECMLSGQTGSTLSHSSGHQLTSRSPKSALRLPFDAASSPSYSELCTAVMGRGLMQMQSSWLHVVPLKGRHWGSLVLDSHAIGLCPSCSTTWVKALTKGPALFEDSGSLPSQSMQLFQLVGSCSCVR